MILQRILMEQDPTGWRMMNGCIMLNLTKRQQVDGVRDELFERWPKPGSMAHASLASLEEVLRPLGMQHRRALTLVKFSRWWLDSWSDQTPPSVELGQVRFPEGFLERVRAMEPPGVGEYARDSWAIFVEGIIPDWEVNDHALLEHLTETVLVSMVGQPTTNELGEPARVLIPGKQPWEPQSHWAARTAR
jgi:hypothetical protein